MIQIDMQMPKCCSECYFAERDLSCGIIALSDMCQLNDKMYSVKKTAKPEYCPLKEVKRDKQYVAADTVVEITNKNTHEVILSTSCKPEPLRCDKSGSKTGKWIEQTDYLGDTYYDCSVCNESWMTIEGTPWVNGMNYCPHCGAKMEFEGR